MYFVPPTLSRIDFEYRLQETSGNLVTCHR